MILNLTVGEVRRRNDLSPLLRLLLLMHFNICARPAQSQIFYHIINMLPGMESVGSSGLLDSRLLLGRRLIILK